MGATGSRIYSHGFEQVFEEAKIALFDCNFKIEAADQRSGKIDAAASMSMSSWGESIKVFVKTTATGIEVTITSKPYTMDWGKSKKNVQNFLNAMDARMRNIPMESSVVVVKPEIVQLPQVASSIPPKPDTEFAVGLAALNAVIALLLGIVYLDLIVELGFCVLGISGMLFLGAILIGSGSYKAGAILCGIGGAITIPIGITGIIAAKKAWSYAK
jgi:hypothetical protein